VPWLVAAGIAIVAAAVFFILKARSDRPTPVYAPDPAVAEEPQVQPGDLVSGPPLQPAEPVSPAPLQPVELVSPPDRTTFDHYPRITGLVWRAVPGAESYCVEHTFLQPGQNCASDAVGGVPVCGLRDTTYTLDFVGAQPGCWRVWAVYPGGEAGPKSGWWQFVYTR
jgi:hypothetical protein